MIGVSHLIPILLSSGGPEYRAAIGVPGGFTSEYLQASADSEDLGFNMI